MIRRLAKGTGWLVQESDHDTTNIVCRYGHIYADGQSLVASLDCATKSQSRQLRKLGVVVADGDFGELSVKFPPAALGAVAAILKPRQKSLSGAA